MNDNQWERPSFDEVFMYDVYKIASKSKDPSTKIGTVLVKDNFPIMQGYNGLPRKVRDDIPERWISPEKYFWCEHGERNAIYQCAKKGIATEGATLYCMGTPCTDCARGIIQAGIVEVVMHQLWEDVGLKHSDKWKEGFKRTATMFEEAGVKVRLIHKFLNVKTMVGGKVHIV